MKISSPTRTALGEPTQLWLPEPAAGFTMMALAGSGGAIGMGPRVSVAAGVASSSWVTHQEYAMRHDSNPTCALRVLRVLRHLYDFDQLDQAARRACLEVDLADGSRGVHQRLGHAVPADLQLILKAAGARRGS